MGDDFRCRRASWTAAHSPFVPDDHPPRRIRSLIDDRTIREACRDRYFPIGRPSIPPEQLFHALVGGYLLGFTGDRKLVVELHCNMALRWFLGLNLDQRPGCLDVQPKSAAAVR